MARRLPRRSCICRSGREARSRPSKVTVPDTRVPTLGSSRMMESAVTLLPQPGSLVALRDRLGDQLIEPAPVGEPRGPVPARHVAAEMHPALAGDLFQAR